MREICASIMLSDPMTFSEQELGKKPEEYIQWLTSGNSAWGGIPELRALAMLYETEIGVVVIQDVEVLLFGKGTSSKRIYVLYDGTHYNLIGFGQQRIFESSNDKAYTGCLELARQCKAKNEAIDPSVFALVCYEC